METINQGDPVLWVKQHNLFWAFFCLAGVGLTTLAVVKPRSVAVLAAAAVIGLTYKFFLRKPAVIDRMVTEVQAGALLIWLSYALIRSLETRKPKWFMISGLIIGALALTKAMFLYVGIGLILTLLVVYLPGRRKGEVWYFVKLMGIMIISTAVIMMPWIIRNRIQLRVWKNTQRGGQILFIRATKNQMNETEYAGAFYYYAPPALKSKIGDYLGFSNEDLQEGGVLQRLNRNDNTAFADSDKKAEREGRPEDAVSFYRSAKAEYISLRIYFEEQGAENPSLLADQTLQRRAINMILDDPVKHLKTTLVFLWRGMWVNIPFAINLAGFLAIWGMALWGLHRKNTQMIGIAVPSIGVLAFHALLTHNIPRYSLIILPNVMVAIVVLCCWCAVYLAGRAANIAGCKQPV
ncbi:MAG: hypothetical protein JXA25_14720 [Anaerolineales bacterium]|nr:hypothetical protein [Anaerolineales bacterium]